MYAGEQKTGRRNEDSEFSQSQRYVLNSVTRSGHIPAVRRSSTGIFRITVNDEDESRIESVGTFINKIKKKLNLTYVFF